jgi:hypothetical protein
MSNLGLKAVSSNESPGKKFVFLGVDDWDFL